jgi:hypothetical protein
MRAALLRLNGDVLAGTRDKKPPIVKKRKDKGALAPSKIVLVDGEDPKVRTWRICSDLNVSVRRGMAQDAECLRYLPPGAEFEAEGPYRLAKGRCLAQWLKISGEYSGFVCTCSPKDASKVVAVLKCGKQSTDSQGATVQAEANVPEALLISREWCQQIFEKGKIWEIRSSVCHKLGCRFAIAESKSGTLVGEATIIDCLKVGRMSKTQQLKRWSKKHKSDFIGRKENFHKHRIADLSIVKYPEVYAWVLDDVVRYKQPVPYTHPQGAVKWVKLDGFSTADANREDAVCRSSSSSSLSE